MENHLDITVIEAPLTGQFIQPGTQGKLKEDHSQIKVGDEWYDYVPRKWKMVINTEKEKSFMIALKEAVNHHDILLDRDFINLVAAYAITEQDAMDWMVKDKSIHRRSDGFWIKQD